MKVARAAPRAHMGARDAIEGQAPQGHLQGVRTGDAPHSLNSSVEGMLPSLVSGRPSGICYVGCMGCNTLLVGWGVQYGGDVPHGHGGSSWVDAASCGRGPKQHGQVMANVCLQTV